MLEKIKEKENELKQLVLELGKPKLKAAKEVAIKKAITEKELKIEELKTKRSNYLKSLPSSDINIYSTHHDVHAGISQQALENSMLWKGQVFDEEEFKLLNLDLVKSLVRYTIRFKGSIPYQLLKSKVIKQYIKVSKKKHNKVKSN